ncbi:hypothetical protein [Burkholderia seminalis]|uniref:hypothetical protein n=1 Tax=Burkholderia seminalis TaxID=488731 RepID=UPI001CF51756|nr:hypothetical protein [Burkholderia seminalis]MCA8427852.1 hypothetical protein [Burkholderia seminalis]MDN7848115.1 hypothetical protein [Burkholderia seminalis]
MIAIPVVNVGTADAPINAPAHPIPDDAIATVCDGTIYTIYQPGDIVPQPKE